MTAGGAIDDIRRARFCKEGDILSSAQALLKLREFGIARGRRKQFDMIKDILISKLWRALEDAHGPPVFEQENREVGKK